MTIPVADQDDLREILVGTLTQYRDVCDDDGEVVGYRQDVLTVLKFMASDTPSVHDAAHLFWNIYQPRLAALSDAGDRSGSELNEDIELVEHPAPAPSEQLDELLLRCLDWVYERFRVPYELDAVDNAEMLLDIVIELHIAAARAFKLKQLETDHMSEEWVTRLRSVERTVWRIEAITSPYGSLYWASFGESTNAIGGMTQLELSHISRMDGSYADAINYLRKAAYSYVEAFHGFPWSTVSLDWGQRDWDEWAIKNEEEIRTHQNIQSRLTPLQVSMEEVSSLFDLLKQSPPADTNWREISEECKELAVLPLMEQDVFTGLKDFLEIDDEWGQSLISWSEFWYGAGAWASAQLSPSEYRKMREYDDRHAAESRLKNYFFRSNWSYLPERAQQRLINADLIWNSLQRVSRESILNDLLRATEEMCEHFIVQPLVNDSPDILGREAKMAERGRSLGVRDYINICELPSLPSLLLERNLAESEITFMTEDLPSSMRNLGRARNPAEHEVSTSTPPVLVDSAYRLFLGIGRPGVLPQLARIGRKLK